MVLQESSPQARRPLPGPRPTELRTSGAPALLVLLVLLGQQRPAAAKVEAGLAAVQQAALAHAGLSPGATTGLLARQHLAALLPQLRLTLGRGWQLSATGRAVDGLTAPVVDDDHTSYAVSASWDLARLLVPHEAMAHHHEEPRRAQLRLALLVKVTQLVGARCRLLRSDGRRAEMEEQVAELEAALELLTGGHALPEVTPGATCPAAPRFELGLPRSEPGPRRVSTSRRGAPLASEGDSQAAGEGWDDRGLGDGGLGGLEAAD